MDKQSAINLAKTYLHLPDGPKSTAHEGGDAFWRNVDQHEAAQDGRLLGVSPMKKGNWVHWEMHPDGDEILVLLKGRMDIILDEKQGRRTVELKAGDTCVVPQGIWHWGHCHEACDLLFITRGKGTEVRAP